MTQSTLQLEAEGYSNGFSNGLVGNDVDSPYPPGSVEDTSFANGFNDGYEIHLRREFKRKQDELHRS